MIENVLVTDKARTTKLAIYFVLLLVTGLGLIASGVLLKLNGAVYTLAFICIVAGALGLRGLRRGGAVITACPRCAHELRFLYDGTKVPVQFCPGCHRWLHGAKTLVEVPADHVSEKPDFRAPLPVTFQLPGTLQWPEECPVCAAPATRTVEVRGVDFMRGLAARAVLPASVHQLVTVQAPACAAHDNGVVLIRSSEAAQVLFRSLPYWRRFCELNRISGEAVVKRPSA